MRIMSLQLRTFVGLLLAGCSLVVGSNVESVPAVACPGAWSLGNSQTIYCVGGDVEGPYLSTCKGWPICSGSATTTWSEPPLSCATVLTWTSGGDNAEFSSLASKASDSMASSGTHFQTTLGATGAGAASSAGLSATGSASASASASTTQSTNSNGSGAVMVSLGLVAGSVLALAVMP